MIHNMQTSFGRTLDEWIGENLLARQIPPERWPFGPPFFPPVW